MSTLIVADGSRQAGILQKTAADTLTFEYTDEYIQLGVPISASLPIQQKVHEGVLVSRFFGNLLPEGDVRSDLNARFRLDDADDFGLLSKIGRECAGALTIYPEDGQSLDNAQPFDELYQPLDDTYIFGQYIQSLEGDPNPNFMGRATRMSLAGAQSKTVLARFNDPVLYRCTGGASTHIVKIGSRRTHAGDETFPGIVFNEYFCMKLAKAINLPVAEVELLPYQTFRDGPHQYVYAIKRFDRSVDKALRRVTRIHQEDFCQALGRSRSQKYESSAGGVTLGEMLDFLSSPVEMVAPAVSRTDFLNAVYFNLIIGNRDSHAKNYSLLRTHQRSKLLPMYDLVCTQIYDGIEQFLPQKIGHATTLEDVRYVDLVQVAQRLNVNPTTVVRRIRELVKATLRAMPHVLRQISAEPFSDEALPIANQIAAVIQRNSDALGQVVPMNY